MELFLITIARLLGIIWGLYFKQGIALFVCIFMFFLIIRRKNKYVKIFCSKKYILLILICFLFSYIQINYLEKDYNQKYKSIEGEIEVIGTIISNPTQNEYKLQYELRVDSVNYDSSYKNTNLILYVKKEKNSELYKYGDKIYFLGDFELPEVQRNTGGFNYREYLKTKNIYGIITTKSNKIKVQKENNVDKISLFANNVATKIKDKINNLLPEKEASILAGILIGNKENLDDSVQEAFRKSNISHILAVSGMHVSYVVMAIGFVISKSKISKKKGKIITVIFLLFFMLVIGQTPSVTRACIMSCYIIIASLFHKRVSIISSLSISLFILLLINPYCIFDIGLQLSYGGTIGIVILYKPLIELINKVKRKIVNLKIENGSKSEEQKNIKKKNIIPYIISKIKQIFIVTISANIVIIPITLYHYNTLSLTFFISNLFVSPIMGIIVILGFFTVIISFIFFPVVRMISFILQILLQILLQIAIKVGELSLSQVYLPTPKITVILIYYLFIITILIFQKVNKKMQKRRIEKSALRKIKHINKKILIVILLIVLTVTFIYKQIPKDLNIYFIDVGQGDSTLIVTPEHKTILIDGGGSKNRKSFDVGENTLMPYLLDRGIINIDYMIISHFDSDHVEGLLTVMEKLKVEQVIISKQGEDSENYKKFKQIINKKKIKVIVVSKESLNKSQKINIEKDIYFNILWPNNLNLISENILNNNSIVAKLNYKNFSMLFTGDIESIAEKQILEEYKNNLQILNATILKVGHHGSKTSTTQEFVEVVKPKIALIGVGKKNTFGHPNDDVIKRLQNMRHQNIQNR